MVLLGTSCTGLKYATEERPMFTAYALRWAEAPPDDAKEAMRELESVVTPMPNNSLFGLRPTVALHNMVREPKKPKGLRNLLKYRIGNAGVYLDQVPLDDITRALQNRMNNRGHFSAMARYDVQHRNKKASVTWTVEPGPVHRIRSIRVGDPHGTGLDSALAAERGNLQVNAGMPYHLARLSSERDRLSDRLRNQGWFRLRSDDLVWVADTTVGGFGVDLHLHVKPRTSEGKRMAYTLGKVTVHGDRDDVLPPSDTTLVNGLHYVNYLGMYRPEIIARGVYLRPGDTYSLRRADLTQRHLTSFGVFRNVFINFVDDSLRLGVLNAEVLLMPQKRFSLFSELNAISKSNNFAGPGLKVGFRDRDLFRGAEQFTIDLNGRFETQIAGAGRGTNAYEISAKAGLSIPRMVLLPFLRTARSSVPQTNIELGYGLFRRVNLYGLESANAGIGYLWREDRRTWHDLRLLDVSFNNLYYTSDLFEEFLAQNPAIRRSFDEQFIIGFGYTWTRSTRRSTAQRHWAVYTLGGDEGGLLTSAIYRGIEGPRPEVGYTMFGQRFSQFVRFRPELRLFQTVGRGTDLIAFRMLAHAAYAYGNSNTVPFVKQFFAGGPNSLRGFPARSVGPGSYAGAQVENLLIDQVGDLRLEANLEYRFTMSGMFKGALFADAGNVWLLNEDPQRPGGRFDPQDFYREIAMNAGFGLRIDPEVIVVRLDLAAPLRRPDLPDGDRWVFNDLDARWRRNFILNIAIGYPF
jgi:outer membrane translocation and assembly module TamA